MINKFNRNYNLYIEDQTGNLVTITLPFTIEFDITRNTLSSANVCQIRIYNLNPKTRASIYFNAANQGTFRKIILEAGYGNSLSTIFSGNYNASWSVREGVNFISQIECYDSGFAYTNADVNVNFVAGTPLISVFSGILKAIPQGLLGKAGPSGNISLGYIGSYGTQFLKKANSYAGNAFHLLSELSGGGFFVDNGQANILSTDAFIPADAIQLISEETGLLNTPTVEQNLVRFEMLFQPSLNVGTNIVVASTTYTSLNGLYKITSIKHRGMISPAVCGSATTTGEFFFIPSGVPALPASVV